MARRQNRFATLDLQLSAIQDVLAAAQGAPSPERRAELLGVVQRALAVYHEEHAALLARPRFTIIKGGAIIAALTLPLRWIRTARRGQKTVALGVVTATVAACALLILRPHGSTGTLPPPTPTVTAPPSPAIPPGPTSAPSSPAPGPSTFEVSPPPVATESAANSEVLPSPTPGRRSHETASAPTGDDEGGLPGEPDEPEVPRAPELPVDPEQPAPPDHGRDCVLDLDLPLLRVHVGSLVCL